MSDLSYLIAKQKQDKFDYYKNQEELQTRRRITEELEEIKAELNNLDFDFGNYYDETEAILNKINSVLDKHIKENKK